MELENPMYKGGRVSCRVCGKPKSDEPPDSVCDKCSETKTYKFDFRVWGTLELMPHEVEKVERDLKSMEQTVKGLDLDFYKASAFSFIIDYGEYELKEDKGEE